MITATAIASIGFFVGAFLLCRVTDVAAGALSTAKEAATAMRDKSLGDEERERTAQKAAVDLAKAFVSILLRSALALLASFLPIWLAGWAGLADGAEVLAYLSRWQVIAIASIVVIASYLVWIRLWPSKSAIPR